MNLLLDTQALLWAQAASSMLSGQARSLLTADTIFKWVTPVNYYEIAIKHKIGKLPELGIPPTQFFEQVQRDGYLILPLKTEHIVAYDRIPLYEDHRGPRSVGTVRPINSGDGAARRLAGTIRRSEV